MTIAIITPTTTGSPVGSKPATTEPRISASSGIARHSLTKGQDIMTISELMLQRQALIEQTQTTEDAIRDALATLYNIHPGDHAKCFKRTISIVSTHVTFRGDVPRLYVTGTDTTNPDENHTYGWDPNRCFIIAKSR